MLSIRAFGRREDKPRREKTLFSGFANNKVADQPAHLDPICLHRALYGSNLCDTQ